MAAERDDGGRLRPEAETEWDRSERRSYRVALAIALAPIPIALLISWAVGSPPWQPRHRPGPGEAMGAAMDHDRPGPATGPGPR